MWTPEFGMKHLKKAEGHIGQNVSIVIKMRPIFLPIILQSTSLLPSLQGPLRQIEGQVELIDI